MNYLKKNPFMFLFPLGYVVFTFVLAAIIDSQELLLGSISLLGHFLFFLAYDICNIYGNGFVKLIKFLTAVLGWLSLAFGGLIAFFLHIQERKELSPWEIAFLTMWLLAGILSWHLYSSKIQRGKWASLSAFIPLISLVISYFANVAISYITLWINESTIDSDFFHTIIYLAFIVIPLILLQKNRRKDRSISYPRTTAYTPTTPTQAKPEPSPDKETIAKEIRTDIQKWLDGWNFYSIVNNYANFGGSINAFNGETPNISSRFDCRVYGFGDVSITGSIDIRFSYMPDGIRESDIESEMNERIKEHVLHIIRAHVGSDFSYWEQAEQWKIYASVSVNVSSSH